MAVPKFLTTPLYIEPKLEILRQPQKRGYRFRYHSEGVTHGGIRGEPNPGENASRVYPTIKLCGYRGAAKVVVTIVTGNSNPNEKALLHAHSLIVNKQKTEGYHVYHIDGKDPVLELSTIAIQHVVKEKLVDTLVDRILQTHFLDKYGWSNSANHADAKHFANLTTFTDALRNRVNEDANFVHRETNQAIVGEELTRLRTQAEDLQKSMDMNRCRLSFQIFLKGTDGHFSKKLDPVYSDIIYDGKTKHGASLKIMRINKVTSSVKGDEEVWLIADKLHADDLEVRFFEDPKPGQINGWEGFGKFQKCDVLKQIVLIFRTPEYHDKHIEQPVNVHMQLRRKSDPDCISEPQFFKYTPIIDRYSIGEKRKKDIPMAEIIDFAQSLQKRPYISSPSNNAAFNFPNVNFLNMISGNQMNLNSALNLNASAVMSTSQFTENQSLNCGNSTYMNLNIPVMTANTNAMDIKNSALLSSTLAPSSTGVGSNVVSSPTSHTSHSVLSTGLMTTSIPADPVVKIEGDEAGTPRIDNEVQVMECSKKDDNDVTVKGNENSLSAFENLDEGPTDSLVTFLNDNILNGNSSFL